MKLQDAYDFYLPFVKKPRMEQLQSIIEALSENFNFEKLEVIETGASQNLDDGCFGLFFCKLALDSEGIFSSVDISPEVIFRSSEMYESFFPNGKIKSYCQDSIKFLENYDGQPNLIHLDSWDLDIVNPVPSMLHGWLEFSAIKEKCPSGSICIIDDNFMKGTTVYWDWKDDYNGTSGTDTVEISYEIVGKGALIYHWAKQEETDWDLVGDHYISGPSIKIIVKKR